ncbi:MAG TPA: hypothetical protein VI299_11055, partial [Polyangiales bacterium]
MIVAVFALAAAGCGSEDAPADRSDDGAGDGDERASTTDAGRADASVDSAVDKPTDASTKRPDAQRPSTEAGSGNTKLDALAGRYL